jgi:hypothetical protein
MFDFLISNLFFAKTANHRWRKYSHVHVKYFAQGTTKLHKFL